ncbi:hypothetical protein NCCP2140_23190 [Pseudoalteromonas sp. NCCP-2140]|uniref:hypothetical protein n=1 Tax=Pseudoalteromonas sp. NCCP-2140 TaxID=2942288 RepID=UPI00203ACCEC|nr:hypothetical protein [Pseudoalteromonas sp. NCCP-2140]GKW53266.1 hypothetical protein NCCP2140_23190 [Pseudoalteromonas sp. NCCP-2140]
MNKWILFLATLLASFNTVAEEQYSKSRCDNIEAERESIRKRMNRSYTARQGEHWNQRLDELFTLLARHCKHPKRSSGKGGTYTYRSNPTALLNTKVHNSTVYSNSYNDDKKRHAWGQFYQLPNRCRAKNIQQADFVWCSENKAEQKALFESAWSGKAKADYKDIVITVKPTITEINANKTTSQVAIKSSVIEAPVKQASAPLNESVGPQLTKLNDLKIWQLALAGIAAMLFVFGLYRWFKD